MGYCGLAKRMATPIRRGDLFAKYLTDRPCSPVGLRYAKNVRPLYEMAGGIPVVKGGWWRRAYPYWTAHLNGDAMLAAWLKTREAFRPPDQWPMQVFPDHVTPRAFAECLLPSSDKARLGGYLTAMKGLEPLAAWAHGWPVPTREWDAMEEVMQGLMRTGVFMLWAYDFDLTGVPMPFTRAAAYPQRLLARAQVETDPLSTGAYSLKWALPAGLLDSPYRMSQLPRKSAGVGPSSKYPCVYPLDTPKKTR